ncbi:hypothetical protein GUITHDRAFT_166926 [Guillardia theta CCMP2712]|uniref:Prolyl 4-hydroxylase alpha subunit Fe(2+) 2OG dioxygenase domain-containing protein n=1 Tax=Guillardia theta (strain CCMP2712) TaxID=905079 RepID=L1I597_GUITC|nr:hypothetical protein GUITHDRAFT_166926 [Guillardia theta CCMP2712]EKX31257.1 hypothetical protein GUITHDRAFT_166926 [Guillardia theta CCMP2712]|eukprot:XP_005818237.1 hypothetical protein GUITHDRAFT_166926 [Guillardia theta CCMP2712]
MLEERRALQVEEDASCEQRRRQHRGLDSIQVLDWDSRVFALPLLQIQNFLSDEEADEVIRLGHEELDAQHGGGWEREVAYGTAFFHYHQSNMSRVLVELEDRIARTTMIRPHPDELPLMFTRQVSCAHAAQQQQIPGAIVGNVVPNQRVRNVHHDKNQRENRVVTVLIYLSDSGEGDGGHTIFPCLPAPAATTGAARRSFSSKFKRLFLNGSRTLSGRGGREEEVKLLAACNEQCLLAHEAAVMNIRPQKGTAVIFWNVLADGSPNFRVWHAACQVCMFPYLAV